MREETGKIQGDLTLVDDLCLRGTVAGNLVVPYGRYLDLRGMVLGDLRIEEGGRADVHGTVHGVVFNEGDLGVWGVVYGGIHDPRGRAILHLGALVGR